MRKPPWSLYRVWTPYLFLAPAIILMGMFVFYPLYKVVIFSFQRYDIITDPVWIGFENYRQLLADPNFHSATWHTLLFFIMVIPFTVLLPLFLALLVDNRVKGITFFRASFYLPVVISMVIAGLAWKWMYAPQGILNYFLMMLQVIAKPVAWLSNPSTALFAIIAVTIWKGLGYYMVIYLAGLQSISREINEAAAIDGANCWQKLTGITIPLMLPYMAVVCLMSSIAAMKVFDEIFVMTEGGPAGETETIVFYLFREFVDLNVGYASAAGVLLFLVLLIFSVLALRAVDKRYA